ncbi:MAG: response regulator [Candidatus Eisenbacteria bacterium]|nr:response regulator [Candidatus Eisenbacteria bacterium]
MEGAERRKKILVVDDELDLTKILRISLEAQGFEVIVASDGQNGLAKAREEKPDLIILDLMLPRIDGYRVCRLLKFDERFRNIPIIMLTARIQETDKKLSLEMGADSFIPKPYDFARLTETVGILLSAPSKVSETR